MSVAEAMQAYTVMQLEHGTLQVHKGSKWSDNDENHDGFSYVVAHSNTGLRYVVVATPLPQVARDNEGGSVLVSLVQPFQQAYVMNPTGYITMGYIAEKFGPPVGDWGSWGLQHLACVTRTIALALGVEDDVDLMAQGGMER